MPHGSVLWQVNPQFYAFRWITLLLTQEFNFADSLHIWDTLLSDPDGPQVGLMFFLFIFSCLILLILWKDAMFLELQNVIIDPL